MRSVGCPSALVFLVSSLSPVGAPAVAAASTSADPPALVSPGSPLRLGDATTRCPTFLWGAVPGARELELIVYPVAADGSTGLGAEGHTAPALRTRLPGSAPGYSPPLARCLERGQSYAWMLRAISRVDNSAGPWSEPSFFAVPAAPSEDELVAALEVLRAFREAGVVDGHAAETGLAPAEAPATAETAVAAHVVALPDRPSARDRERFPAPLRAGARATAPSPTASASLSLSSNLRLGASSNVFKDGDLLFWDDEDGNTALGRAALASNTFGKSSTAFGTAALRNHLGEDFVEPNYKIASYQTAIGYKALFSDLIGYSNTAVGANALRDNKGNFNTAVGAGALLENTTGQRNVAVGNLALRDNSTASDNVAIGHDALLNNIASRSTAVGSGALRNGLGSTRNTAIGFEAMYAGASANENTAVGGGALRNGTGFANTAVGAGALDNLADITEPEVFTVGNVAIGQSALGSLEEGDFNAALGPSAGANLVSGDGNVYISHGGAASENSTIRIGNGGHAAAYLGGVFGQTAAGGSTVFVSSDGKLGTSTSSRRFKEQIRDVGAEADAIFDLRPVSFRYKNASAGDRMAEADGLAMPLEYGLVAEEVAEVMPELVIHDTEGRPSVVRYHLLVPLLLEELQRQERTIADQEKRLQKLERRSRQRPR